MSERASLCVYNYVRVVGGGGGETERERQTDRQTDRQRQRQIETDRGGFGTERQTYTQTERQIATFVCRHVEENDWSIVVNVISLW